MADKLTPVQKEMQRDFFSKRLRSDSKKLYNAEKDLEETQAFVDAATTSLLSLDMSQEDIDEIVEKAKTEAAAKRRRANN